MKIKFTSIILFCFSLLVWAHPIKMTTSKIIYNSDSGNLEILINFFIDDFSAHLQDVYHLPAESFTDAETDAKGYVTDYISKKLHVSINYEKQPLAFQNMEIIDDNVLQVLLCIENIKGLKINTLNVQNELLLEAFNDQSNMMHIKIDPGEKAQLFRFSKGNSIKVFKINYLCR